MDHRVYYENIYHTIPLLLRPVHRLLRSLQTTNLFKQHVTCFTNNLCVNAAIMTK